MAMAGALSPAPLVKAMTGVTIMAALAPPSTPPALAAPKVPLSAASACIAEGAKTGEAIVQTVKDQLPAIREMLRAEATGY